MTTTYKSLSNTLLSPLPPQASWPFDDESPLPTTMPPKQPQTTASGFEKIPYNLQPLVAADIDAIQPIAGDTEQDIRDIKQLGKKQEFKRNFGFIISTLGFISIYMATWEFMLVSLSAGLINGGYGGLFWTFIVTIACYSTIVASIAEMESMAPTSGGQYHFRSQAFYLGYALSLTIR